MGRPREHDERTAAALLAAAERAVTDDGIDALSVRGVAAEVGTTTRAVYSVFGSKDGLVAALAARPFELLREGLQSVPVTDDPAADLVAAALMYRRFSNEHPALWALGMQYVTSRAVNDVAWESLSLLKERLRRLADAGRLHGRTVDQATLQFHALCEGMAAVELRGRPGVSDWEAMWRQGFEALVAGFAQPATVSHSA